MRLLVGLREFRRRTEEDKKSKVLLDFKQQQYLGIQSVDKEELNMNLEFLEQRRREVRKHTEIRRTYNLEESTMAQARNKISKIAKNLILLRRFNPKLPWKSKQPIIHQ